MKLKKNQTKFIIQKLKMKFNRTTYAADTKNQVVPAHLSNRHQ
jgi:hypothetical protein